VRRILTIVFMVTVLAAGCGPKAREIAPVSGKVMLDGKPLANANVAFMPQATAGTVGHVTSRGRTDAQGNYTLKTADDPPREGAVVGTHKVYIATGSSDALAEVLEDQATKGPRERVPAKYNAQTSLKRDVPPEGKSDMNFDLTK
jgi:hypothetical protein